MTRATDDRLVDVLREQVGDGLRLVVRYTEADSDVLYGEEWFERYLEAVDTRSPEKMHADAVSRLQQASLASDLYDAEVTSEIRVTERGTAVHLYPSEREGVLLWFDADADLAVPTVTNECVRLLREQA